MKERIDLIKEGGLVRYELEYTVFEGVMMEFTLYRVVAWDGEDSTPADTEVESQGSIKWDGCSDIRYGEGESLHECTLADVRRRMAAELAVFAIAKEKLHTEQAAEDWE